MQTQLVPVHSQHNIQTPVSNPPIPFKIWIDELNVTPEVWLPNHTFVNDHLRAIQLRPCCNRARVELFPVNEATPQKDYAQLLSARGLKQPAPELAIAFSVYYRDHSKVPRVYKMLGPPIEVMLDEGGFHSILLERNGRQSFIFLPPVANHLIGRPLWIMGVV